MIPKYFEDREIFITGGSGVVGKALIDKLLRSCNVRKIYLLIRPKKGVSIPDRLEKIKKATLFRRLHAEKPNEFTNKVVPISGDVSLPMIGISMDDIKQLENVSVVFHGAATVRFDEPLLDAVRLNVGGTLETLKFAEKLKRLEVFMHISTFFSNPHLNFIDTKLYEAPMDWRFVLDLCNRKDIDEYQLNCITSKLLNDFPNTYAFTKNLAESLVNDYRYKLPVAIFRPSIVVFAIDEPEPGFPTSLTGAMGLFAVSGAGVLKCIYMPKGQRLDMCPQDLCIKTLMYYTVRTSNIYGKQIPPDTTPIYHICSYPHSRITFPEWIDLVVQNDLWIKYAFEKTLLKPGLICTDSSLLYMFVTMVAQVLPSLLIDGLLIVFGQKPQLMSVQRKIYVNLWAMRPFMTKNYESNGTTHYFEMLKELKGTDFQVDALEECKKYNVSLSYMQAMVPKVREVLFKQDPSTIPRARNVMMMKIYLFKALKVYFTYKLFVRFVLPFLLQWNMKSDWSNSNSTLPI
ncbi:putative fatty acyl-CoA reductase CG5065 [Haematobia irritans]|uniref:putative fatty acyl-CoA reductase CG5065 n=1 Tax=Haematobia irritans TaxID=7368 RepID=UPI003F507346